MVPSSPRNSLEHPKNYNDIRQILHQIPYIIGLNLTAKNRDKPPIFPQVTGGMANDIL